MVPGTPYDSSRVDALLVERGATARPDGMRVWRLKNGDVEVGELRENGQVVATEVRVPLSDRTELMREAVEEAATLAQAAEVRLVDPQLGRPLTANDSGSVAEQYLRTARYAGEMMGLSEAVSASYAAQPEGFPTGGKVLLGIVGFLIVLYLVVNGLISQLGG
ncbi:hypothetical protein [Hyalangium rubrum]|uniref:Uncharacterized protein n=1 Tax=Hyalangium rubrum TaxID=3103134 RepID=A0ABU5H6J5_9BACT|nr:hypothetical protein [Hyalangium sp. s54d21]MDY7228714.1 hypothetical protein [Hyalangium sp. s54d21]